MVNDFDNTFNITNGYFFINIFLFHQIHLRFRLDYSYRCYMTCWRYFRYIVVVSFIVTIMTWLTVTEQNVCVTDDHLYVPFVIVTIPFFFPHWWPHRIVSMSTTTCAFGRTGTCWSQQRIWILNLYFSVQCILLPLSICSYSVAIANKLYIFR